jgi:hypothetical protein
MAMRSMSRIIQTLGRRKMLIGIVMIAEIRRRQQPEEPIEIKAIG